MSKNLMSIKFIPVILFIVLNLPLVLFAQNQKSLEITNVTTTKIWVAEQQQQITVQVKIPKDFHAYADQIKIINIKPDDFKAGQITIKPEIDFFDVHSKKTRKGLVDTGFISILFEAPGKVDEKLSEISFDLRHQICSDQVCYLPKNINVKAQVVSSVDNATSAESQTQSSDDKSLMARFTKALDGNLPLAFLFVFLAGILTSFTPCIFPMIPITLSILGHDAEKNSRKQNFFRSLFYVFGIAITYSVLGVIAALTGNLFGAALSNKYVLIGMSLLFAVMALGMWGGFDVQVPTFIRNRFGVGRRSEQLGETFILGLIAGVVASPCVGPVLISILSFVSATRNVILGFSFLFTFALGLGFLFMLIGFFSESIKLLPKSGPWMNFVKFLLGAAMWGASLYYIQFLLPDRWWWALVAASLMGITYWQGAFNFQNKKYLRRSFLLAVFVFSTTVFLLVFIKPEYLKPLFHEGPSQVVTKSNQINWIPYSDDVIKQAKNEKVPVLLDFGADWCGACHDLEAKTYSTPEFHELTQGFKLVKLDATLDNEPIRAILKRYKVQGLPTVIFIDRHGKELKDLTFTQFITWEKLKPKVLEASK